MMKLLNATVSHDIISPINIIKNFVEEMLQQSLQQNEKGTRRYYQLIMDTHQLVTCRMQDLLDQSLIEHNCFIPREVEFSPFAAVTKLKSILES